MKLIEDYRALPEKKQVQIALSLFILIVLIVISIGAMVVRDMYLADNPLDGTVSEPVAEDTESGEAEEVVELDAVSAEERTDYDSLTDIQRALVEAYTDEEKDFIVFLSANIWTADKETRRLVFSEYSFKETKDAEEGASTSFAISALTKTTETESGATIEITTAALQTSTSSKLIELQKVTDKEGRVTYSLTSETFRGARTYVRTAGAANFTLKGVENFPAFLEVIGQNQTELEEALKNYVAVTYPSAARATFEGRALIDWSANTVTFSVVLNNESNTQLNVVYHAEEKFFSVGELR